MRRHGTMREGILAGAAILAASWAMVALARGLPGTPRAQLIASIERTVPVGASLQYEIRGRVIQSLDLRPGTYRVTVERLR